ncbi:hypothetical protein MAPG_08222 [Magnaporthiopsis poae ATCC 64411]|uniref:Major facilitator superfamily (MFS) profile domain-containing protein n=1 Tax=Magnaporthiopsis poae (strain ATCC 64411 / 73-15) TaxID=644358 RepID=A0A0C4E6S6_MAGP6|nr:hypothetical protein MAPG_08222 [Magnaporthiopsis poae ATCC 64411]
MRGWLGRGRPLRLGVTICCLFAFVLFGYEQGVFGPILQNEDWKEQFSHPDDSLTGIIVSCYNLGCLTGCIVTYFVGEKMGRRWTIWLAMGVVIVGTTLQISSYTVPHLIVGRIVTGVGTGMKTSTVPMYQAELCEGTSRGRLISAETLFVGVGIVSAYWFNFGMSFVQGSIAWRLPISLQILFAIGVIILVFALPESPRWLFNHGREAEAVEVLCAVYDRGPEDELIVAEKTAIIQAIELERSSLRAKSFFSILQRDDVNTRRRVLLAWLAQFANQLGGINLVVYYIPSVLEINVGMSVRQSQILGGCINLMFPIGSLLPTLALDRMGRRKTMMVGSLALGVCMLFISALLSQAPRGEDTGRGQAFSSASIAFFFLYMLFFGMSMNSVPWVYVPEILPLEARTRGTAVGVSSNWLWNFTVVMITPIIINRLEWRAYLIFMVTNLLFVPMFYFFFPETSNLRLEDIDHIFAKEGNPVKQARRIQARLAQGLPPLERDAEMGKAETGGGTAESGEKSS